MDGQSLLPNLLGTVKTVPWQLWVQIAILFVGWIIGFGVIWGIQYLTKDVEDKALTEAAYKKDVDVTKPHYLGVVLRIIGYVTFLCIAIPSWLPYHWDRWAPVAYGIGWGVYATLKIHSDLMLLNAKDFGLPKDEDKEFARLMPGIRILFIIATIAMLWLTIALIPQVLGLPADALWTIFLIAACLSLGTMLWSPHTIFGWSDGWTGYLDQGIRRAIGVGILWMGIPAAWGVFHLMYGSYPR